MRTKKSTPPTMLATVCVGTKATTTRPSEKISTMASARERMKNGMSTVSGAPKIAATANHGDDDRHGSEDEVDDQLRAEQS